MKRKISVFIILSILLSAAPMLCMGASENVEILFSETFEGDLSRWKCHDDRECVSILESEDEYIGSYLSIKPGSTMAKVMSGGGSVPYSIDQSIYSPMIDINSAEDYTFAVDIQSRGSQKAYVSYFNETGAMIHNQIYTLKPDSDTEWNCFSAQLNIPDDATKLQIGLFCVAEKPYLWTAYYDNVMICKGRVGFNKDIKRRKIYAPLAVDDSNTMAEKQNCVFNETFEKGKSDWTYLNEKSDKNFKATTDNSFTGIRSLYVTDELMESPVGLESKPFTVVPGAEYTLSFDAINNVGSGISVYIRFLNSENKLVASQSASNVSRGWTSCSVSAVAPDDAQTAQIRIISKDYTGKNYVDNIKIILSKPAPEFIQPPAAEMPEVSKYDDIYQSSLQLFVGSPNAIVNGKKTLIDITNDKVVAQIVDSRTLVPVRFIAENYGADVLWDDATKTVTLKLPDKTVTVVLNKNEINIDGTIVEIDVPAQSIEGRTMLPLRAFVSEVMNKNVFWDNRGLIVITDEQVLDAEKDMEIVNRLIENII